MTKLLSIIMCIVFSLGIIVSSLSNINSSVVRDGGLRDRAVSWIDQAIP
ncbi:hypothetical protein BRE01_66310 [Brevibacillus reuszeri]|uniref:Uncharacterized protein n=1 Tax=Brevibacillus reuszeri TaxID=54915 RepID=A0ABQ0TYU6_9BACL|nr:hypothetical protein [Brevibacillus reuszeri]MED1859670.1 hypothetical protein [Brevibacillus reuszeri]GED72929.1 hypothetical protein BRE01_66310 [Brevibacillus reuszeri]